MSAPLLPDRITPVTQELFEQTYGGSLICCMVALVLYGLSVLQTYIYFLQYEDDRLAMKLMVLVVWMLESIHMFFICHTVYHYSILSYTRPDYLIDGEWSVYTAIAIGVVICFFVQVFFARTIYHLTRGVWKVALTTMFTILIIVQIGFGLLLVVKIFQLWELEKLKDAVYIAMVPLFTVRVVSDAATAMTLCTVFYNSRSEYSRSAKLINTLIVYAINRFVLTAVVVTVQTIILIVRPESTWAMVIEFVSAHIYVNSFLATLNARRHLREKAENFTSIHIHNAGGGAHPGTRSDGSTAVEFDITGNGRRADFGHDSVKSQTLELAELPEQKKFSNKSAEDCV